MSFLILHDMKCNGGYEPVSITNTAPDGFVIKYRYVLEKRDTLQETNIPGDTIRYRLLYVKGATTTTISCHRGKAQAIFPYRIMALFRVLLLILPPKWAFPEYSFLQAVYQQYLWRMALLYCPICQGNQTMVVASMDGRLPPIPARCDYSPTRDSCTNSDVPNGICQCYFSRLLPLKMDWWHPVELKPPFS